MSLVAMFKRYQEKDMYLFVHQNHSTPNQAWGYLNTIGNRYEKQIHLPQTWPVQTDLPVTGKTDEDSGQTT